MHKKWSHKGQDSSCTLCNKKTAYDFAEVAKGQFVDIKTLRTENHAQRRKCQKEKKFLD